MPGFTTYTWFKALHANELYHGQCAQLCGRQHAYMTALVKVVTPQQYTRGSDSSTQLINEQNDQVAQIRAVPGQAGHPDIERQLLTSKRPSAHMSTTDYALPSGTPDPRPRGPVSHARHSQWLDWVLTTDHKKIGIMYLVLTFVFFMPRRRRGAADALAAGGPEQHADQRRALQPAADAARDDDDLPVRRAGDGRLRQLLRAADDRRARHGLPAPERALVLAAADGRDRLLRVAVLASAGSGLVELPAALEHPVLAQRRPGRLDLPDPPHRHLLAGRRDQLLRDDREHARARHDAGAACRCSSGRS